jgi:hypothetical protein
MKNNFNEYNKEVMKRFLKLIKLDKNFKIFKNQMEVY